MEQEIMDKIQKWLADEGMFREIVQDDTANFHYSIDYPPNSNNRMDIIQPKGKNDMIVIASGTTVSPVHLQKIKGLSNKKREAFLWGFKFLLNNLPVDITLQQPEGILQRFAITDTIFIDGLTKDRLMRTIRCVFKAKIQGIWKIQEEFGISGEEQMPESPMYG
jgi:hypothetical protein